MKGAICYDMEYNDFKNKLKKLLEKKITEGYKVYENTVLKNNSILLDSFVICNEETNVSPNFYVKHYFKMYEDGMPLDYLVDDIIEKFEENVNCPKYEKVDIEFDKVKSRIVGRLISKDKNEMLLKTVPHIDIMDLSVIFYILLDYGEKQCTGFRLTNSLFEKWNDEGVDLERLYDLALKNSSELLPVMMTPLIDFIEKISDISELDGIAVNNDLFVLTNESMLHGAFAVFYEGMLEKIYEEIGGEYFVLPSSVHEVIIYKDNGDGDTNFLINMVVNVNQNIVCNEDILYDNVYKYNSSTKSLEMVEFVEGGTKSRIFFETCNK